MAYGTIIICERRKSFMKKFLSVVLCFVMVSALFAGMGGLNAQKAQAADRLQNSTENRTKDEVIAQYDASLPEFNYSQSVYEQEPSITAPYAAGSLKTQVIDDTLRQINYLRWLAGMDSVSLLEDRMEYNQAGGVLMASTSTLAHSIAKPSDMDDDFYSKASKGIGSGSFYPDLYSYVLWSANCSAGDYINDSIKGYTDDTNNVQASSVGHRLSILDYKSASVSFGSADGGSYRRYSCLSMYRYSTRSSENDAEYYSWPSAGYFPTESIDSNALWSVTLGDDYTASSDISVYFSVDGVNYSAQFDVNKHKSYYNSILIWLPDEVKSLIAPTGSYEDGAEVGLIITGIKDKNGDDKTISHTVKFFNASSIVPQSISVWKHASGNSYSSFNYISMEKGEECELWIVFNPNDSTNKKISLESTIPGAVSFTYTRIDHNGVFISLKALRAGTPTVTLRSEGNPALTKEFTMNITSTEPEPELKISRATLKLENDITVIFKADAQLDTIYHDLYVEVVQETADGTKTQTINGQLSADGQFYEFAYTGVNAKEVGDLLDATIYGYVEDTLVQGETKQDYSVKQYCMSQLSKTDAELSALGLSAAKISALRTLMVDLLNYAATAQNYFGYKTTALANADLTAAQLAYASDDSVLDNMTNVTNTKYETISSPTASWKAAGLNLLSKTTIRVKFAYDGDTEDIAVVAKVNGIETYITQFDEAGAGAYYAYFDGIKASQFDSPVDFVIMSGDTKISNTLRYSVESYASKNKDNVSVGDIVCAMMKYGKSAKAYAG